MKKSCSQNDLPSNLHAQFEALRAEMSSLQSRVHDLEASVEARVRGALLQRMFVPNLLTSQSMASPGEFMRYSTCSSADFFHPRYRELCELIGIPVIFNRKMWEWVCIVHTFQTAGVLADGMRGLAFGVGKEPLPALFARFGATVVATDAPDAIAVATGWKVGDQFSGSVEHLRYPDIVSSDVFDSKVTHRPCDMNAIDEDLRGFDFTWSSCSFEHLGSLEAGIQFVINSVENTLKPGGIACHTTEFNLSSETETVESGPTVIYRRKDMQELVDRLRARGHTVKPFAVAPDSHFLDYYVDAPPFGSNPHFKLLLGKFVTTSVSIVVRRG